MMWWWGREGHMGAAGWVGMAFMILFWIAVVVVVVYVIRYFVSRPSSNRYPDSSSPPAPGPSVTPPQESDALRILQERYAKGDIDRDEFLRRRDDLRG